MGVAFTGILCYTCPKIYAWRKCYAQSGTKGFGPTDQVSVLVVLAGRHGAGVAGKEGRNGPFQPGYEFILGTLVRGDRRKGWLPGPGPGCWGLQCAVSDHYLPVQLHSIKRHVPYVPLQGPVYLLRLFFSTGLWLCSRQRKGRIHPRQDFLRRLRGRINGPHHYSQLLRVGSVRQHVYFRLYPGPVFPS